MKIQNFLLFFFLGGGGGSGLEGSGWGGGVRVDVNRSEVFVKIQNKIGGSGRGVFGGSGWM